MEINDSFILLGGLAQELLLTCVEAAREVSNPPSRTRRYPMTAFINLLADLDSVKFHISLTVAVICMYILVWIIGTDQVF